MNQKHLITTVTFGFAVLTILLASGIFSPAHAVVPATGPKSGGLKITQYTGTTAEMDAFETGSLDIQDWPAPFARAGPTGSWNTCGSVAPIAVNCEGDTVVTDAKCAADNAVTPGICTPHKVELYGVEDIGIYEFEFQNFDYSKCNNTLYPGSCTSQSVTNGFNPFSIREFRHAIAKLIDHANQLTSIAGSFGIFKCDPAPNGLPWDLHSINGGALPTCAVDTGATGAAVAYTGVCTDGTTDLSGIAAGCAGHGGYATNNGPLAVEPFDPATAKQLVHNLGFTPCVGNATFYCAPGTHLSFMDRVEFRSDDPLRTAFGQYLCAQMGAGSTFATSAPDAGTALPVTCRAVSPVTASIFGAPWDGVEVYTGGWSVLPDPTYLYNLWDSAFASNACGGTWTSTGPTNYICYLNGAASVEAIQFAPNANLPAFQAGIAGNTYCPTHASDGYCAGRTALKQFESDLPMYVLYDLNAKRPVSRHDETPSGGILWVPGPCVKLTPCWKDVVNFRDSVGGVGYGPDSYDTLLNMQTGTCSVAGQDPCLNSNVDPTRSTFYSGNIDYGFRFPIIKANPLTSQFPWDYLLMNSVYETLIVRDSTSVFNWYPHIALNSPSYTASANGFDPTNLANPDWADYLGSASTPGCVTATLCSYIRFRLPAEGTPGAPVWTNGDPFVAEDVAFSIQYCQVPSTGCFNFPTVQDVRSVQFLGAPNPDGSHNIVLVELNKQSAWTRNDIGAGYLLVNHKAFGCAPVTGGTGVFANSYDPTKCYATPDSQFVWQNSANHITLGPWVMSGTVSNSSPNFLYPNRPDVAVTPVNTGSCSLNTAGNAVPGYYSRPVASGACPGYYQEARLSGNDPDANRDGKVNLLDFAGWAAHQGHSYPSSWSLTLDSNNVNDPRADFNNDGKVNVLDFSIWLIYQGLPYPCPFSSNLSGNQATGPLSCASV